MKNSGMAVLNNYKRGFMSYIFNVSKKSFLYKNDELDEQVISGVFYFSKNLDVNEIKQIISAYKEGKIEQYFNNFKKELFLFILYSEREKGFLIFNDKLSSNEIFFIKKKSGFYCSNDIKLLFREARIEFNLNIDNVYSHLIFSSILAPKTIYKEVKSLPAANFLRFNIIKNKLELCSYWKIDELFLPKEDDYEKLLKDVRAVLKKILSKQKIDETAIALSGGVDSGGLLGFLTHFIGEPIKSITVGPHGPSSNDLKSSRKVVKHFKSPNVEIYPEFDDLKKLPGFFKSLNQPIDAHFMFFNSLVLKQAQKLNVKKIIYGFGTNLTLGTQMINRASFIMEKVEKFIPKFFLKNAYKVISTFKKYSKNKAKFLETFSWKKRWLQTKSPVLVHEENFYKKFDRKAVIDVNEAFLKKLWSKSGTDMVEKIILAEYTMWTMNLQFSFLHFLSKKYDIIPVIPFDTVAMTEVIFKTPNKFRRLNKWDKQVIRDVFKPFVSERLYKNKPKSGIIAYGKLFKGREEKIFEYLKRSKVISEVVDLDFFEKEYSKKCELGHIVMKYLGLAVWYDVNWNKSNLDNFDKIFKKKPNQSSA